MLTRVGIVGQCQLCERLVTNELRPVNGLNIGNAKRLAEMEYTAQKIKEPRQQNAEAMAKQNDQDSDAKPAAEAEQQDQQKVGCDEIETEWGSNFLQDFQVAATKSKALIQMTGTILNLVRQEFRRPAGTPVSRLSEDNAEAIISMLAEEK
ncbi:hypothetical protein KR018_007126, partial [Drosophila ironensis]